MSQTTIPNSNPDPATTSDVTDAEEACTACAHPLSTHDTIEARYCRATTALALARGCICGSLV